LVQRPASTPPSIVVRYRPTPYGVTVARLFLCMTISGTVCGALASAFTRTQRRGDSDGRPLLLCGCERGVTAHAGAKFAFSVA
jgi:hypothetical protein